MARERKRFIVSQVHASIEYLDAAGKLNKVLKAVKIQAADSNKNLTDAQKHALKLKRARELVRQTIASMKREGATKCSGTIDGRLYARVGFTDDQGKRHDRVRAAESLTHGRELIKELLRDLDDRGSSAMDADRMTFADLASYFEKHYLKPAEYIDGRKIEGVRSLKPAQSAVNALKAYFGKR
jgi:hypothetical protein